MDQGKYKRTIKNYLETKENEITAYKNQWDGSESF